MDTEQDPHLEPVAGHINQNSREGDFKTPDI